MPDSYTTRNRLTKQEIGSNEATWGNILNDGVIALVDDSLDGQISLDVTLGNITLTQANGTPDQARYRYIEVLNTSASNRELILPDVQKIYMVKFVKSGTGNLTIRNLTDATGVTLTASFEGIVRCSGSLTTLFDPTIPPTPPTPITTILQAAYPVGSVYINTSDSTNPATIFGFGTWAAFAQGRMLLGVGSGTDINSFSRTFTNGEIGGEYRHSQSVAEMPSHTHTAQGQAGGGSGTGFQVMNASGTNVTSSAGSSAAMQWLPPFITTYIWTRTA